MSRIVGIVRFESGRPLEPLLDAMLSSVGQGGATEKVFAGNAGLGHWGWRAPGARRVGDVLVAIDGAFYNRRDFNRESDAHLLADLYERHGFARALELLNGDFAVALYDLRKDELFLGRDRFGVKPLYYVRTPQLLAFSSRPKPLLGVPGVSPKPNDEFVALFAGSHYRTFDNAPERSPYSDVHQLPAAHTLQVTQGVVRTSAYFVLTEKPDIDLPEPAIAEQYRSLLHDAVSIRLANAEKPVFTLSGGMDSSSVLASAVRSSGTKQHAISTVYEDATYDESAEIQSMLAETVERWHPVRIGNPDLAADVSRLVAAHDEPVATATWLSHYLLCEKTRELGFGNLFGGLGGDELNAGEFEYFFFFFADLKAAGRDELLEHETAKWVEHHDHPIFKKSPEVMRRGLERLVDLKTPGRCLPDRARLLRYASTLAPGYFDLTKFEPVMDAPFTSYLRNRTYQDIYRETAPCCLRAADRQATAFGLDVTWPFFDHRVVELMFRVPGTMKIRSGVTKHILREAMRGVLPEETRTRVKKTGWNAPAHVWFTGTGRELILDMIGSRSFRERGIYDVVRVRELLEEHNTIVLERRQQDNHMMFFWQLLNLELWLSGLS